MSTAVANVTLMAKPSLLATMAARFNMDADTFGKTVRATVMPAQHTNEQFAALMMVAHTYNLNPVVKEIYAFPAKGGGIVPIVSIDGWLNLINSHPQADGFEIEFVDDAKNEPVSCTVRMYRKDRSRPTVVTEYLSECIRNTDPWKMKHRMLRHKAMIQAARYTFGFSGIYDEDEGAKIADVSAMTPTPPPAPPVAIAAPVETAKPEPVQDAEIVEAEPVTTAVSDFREEIANAQDHDTLSDILSSWSAVMAGLPMADRVEMQNAYEARVAALDAAAKASEPPAEPAKPEPAIWAVAREKVRLGSKRFKLWCGSLSIPEQEDLSEAPDDWAEIAARADEGRL